MEVGEGCSTTGLQRGGNDVIVVERGLISLSPFHTLALGATGSERLPTNMAALARSALPAMEEDAGTTSAIRVSMEQSIRAGAECTVIS